MFDIIVACTKNWGIGLNNNMAWKCKEELKLFREKTLDSVLIMGRKTVENLPKLRHRYIICVTRNRYIDTSEFNNGGLVCPTIEKALELANERFPGKKVFVAGGGQIYNECFRKPLISQIDKVHISYMKEEYDCDTYFHPDFDNFVIEKEQDYEMFTHFLLTQTKNGERQYLDLINEVSLRGTLRKGRNAITKSLFTRHLSFDLRNGFPLLTTKKMFTRGILEELIFFLKGETNSKILEEKNVNIWKGNTDRAFLDSLGMTERDEGVMGPCFTSYANVLTNFGYKNIIDVKVEDKLYSHTGKWCNIIEKFEKEHNGDIYNINIWYHPLNINCTPEHPFYVLPYEKKSVRNPKHKIVKVYDNPKWVEAQDLDKTKHLIGFKIETEEITPTINNLLLDDKEQWFMFGYFVGDGWLCNEGSKYNRINFAINHKQEEYVTNRIRNVLNIQEKNRAENCSTYRCLNKIYSGVLKTFGKYAHGKIIPDWVHKAPKHLISEFLYGYCTADGYETTKRSRSGKVLRRHTTVSKDIAYSIQRLYLKLGKIASVQFQKRGYKKQFFKERPKESFFRDCYFIDVYMEEPRRNNNSIIMNGYAWFDICKIDVSTQSTTVYNFDVEDDHSYTVDNLSVHNCYGYQWRYFNAPYDEKNAKPCDAEEGIDQIKNVIDLIKNDPHSRRILLTSYNPEQLDLCVLPPCHTVIGQFYVNDNYLDFFCYNRSSDLFLGLPFNIASSAFLLSIFAKLTGLEPRFLNISLGDAHIYESHLDVIDTQVSRIPYKFPTLQITKELKELKDLDLLTPKDFVLSDYKCHPTIKKQMVA